MNHLAKYSLVVPPQQQSDATVSVLVECLELTDQDGKFPRLLTTLIASSVDQLRG